MNNQNPATPDSGVNQNTATPGNNEQKPSAQVTPAGKGENTYNVPEGKVVIDSKEYADLQRQRARLTSIQKRNNLGNKIPQKIDGGNPTDDAINEELANATRIAQDATMRAYKAELKSGVRELLEREEFKNIHPSTKALILKNPSSLTEATDVDEALIDIEDFLVDNMGSGTIPANTTETITKKDPEGHETPKVQPGAPSNPGSAGGEDISKLTGRAKTQAMLRNKFAKK